MAAHHIEEKIEEKCSGCTGFSRSKGSEGTGRNQVVLYAECLVASKSKAVLLSPFYCHRPFLMVPLITIDAGGCRPQQHLPPLSLRPLRTINQRR